MYTRVSSRCLYHHPCRLAIQHNHRPVLLVCDVPTTRSSTLECAARLHLLLCMFGSAEPPQGEAWWACLLVELLVDGEAQVPDAGDALAQLIQVLVLLPVGPDMQQNEGQTLSRLSLLPH